MLFKEYSNILNIAKSQKHQQLNLKTMYQQNFSQIITIKIIVSQKLHFTGTWNSLPLTIKETLMISWVVYTVTSSQTHQHSLRGTVVCRGLLEKLLTCLGRVGIYRWLQHQLLTWSHTMGWLANQQHLS